MTGFRAVYFREIKAYFATPVAYVFLVIFLAFASFLTFQEGFFEVGEASLRLFFLNMPMLFLFLAPALSMRLWAEERQTNTIELLFSLPITTAQAVLGKFLAAWTMVALALLLTFPMALTVARLGDPDAGPMATGYLACLLLAGTYMAIGSFFSALTRNQVIAFVLAVVGCGAFYLFGSPEILENLSQILPESLQGLVGALEGFGLQSRFESMQRGVLELGDICFFVLLAAGWIWATVVLLTERRAAG